MVGIEESIRPTVGLESHWVAWLPSFENVFHARTDCAGNFRMGEDVKIDVGLKFNTPPSVYGVGLIVCDLKGNIVTVLNTLRDDIFLTEEKEKLTVLIRDNHFAPGEYIITISVCDENGMFSYDKLDSCLRFHVEMERSSDKPKFGTD